MGFLGALIICIAIVTFGGELFVFQSGAFEGAGKTEIYVNVVAGLCIYVGILSSVLFDRFDKRFVPESSVFRNTDLMVAAILSPIVFLSVLPLMRETQDRLVQFLVAYQNGFLFQNIITRVRGAGAHV